MNFFKNIIRKWQSHLMVGVIIAAFGNLFVLPYIGSIGGSAKILPREHLLFYVGIFMIALGNIFIARALPNRYTGSDAWKQKTIPLLVYVLHGFSVLVCLMLGWYFPEMFVVLFDETIGLLEKLSTLIIPLIVIGLFVYLVARASKGEAHLE